MTQKNRLYTEQEARQWVDSVRGKVINLVHDDGTFTHRLRVLGYKNYDDIHCFTCVDSLRIARIDCGFESYNGSRWALDPFSNTKLGQLYYG
jgi:hypothetical protein